MNRLNNLIFLSVLMVLTAFPAYSQSVDGENDTLYSEISARLMVKDRKAAADTISLWAESRGGYYTEKSMDRLILRIPDRAVEELKSLLAGTAEEVLDFSQNARNLREGLMSARSSLTAREDILRRNLEYLDQSDLEGTLTLELEIRRLMTEIDRLKGTIRKMENDRAYARVELLLSFKTRTIPNGQPSRFEWINTVDFFDFVNAPVIGSERGRKGPQLPLPEGFALSSERPWFQALSPEGVTLRLRSVKNYPEQSGTFWKKALFSRLEGLGYVAIGGEEELVMDDGTPFLARRWGVPLGRKDYIYITAVRVRVKEIEVLEIAGEAEYLKEYF